MRPAPLPVRDGLGPARLRLRGGSLAGKSAATGELVSVLEEFRARFGDAAALKVLAGEVVDPDGVVLDGASVRPPGSHVYFYRELPDEVPVPFDIPVLHRDDDIVVVDKPHFLATMPRGRHVAQTALVRLRRELELPELSPAHRLDRLTAGVLLFTTRRELRGPYQTAFARGLVRKTYLARSGEAPATLGTAVDPNVLLPRIIRNRLVKRRGCLQATEEAGEPNAETLIELSPAIGWGYLPLAGECPQSPDGLYRLTPRTGRTHQLRVHMASLGLPIDNDPLYPEVLDSAAADFTRPLQLLAHTLEFDDPLTGRPRRFVSRRHLARI